MFNETGDYLPNATSFPVRKGFFFLFLSSGFRRKWTLPGPSRMFWRRMEECGHVPVILCQLRTPDAPARRASVLIMEKWKTKNKRKERLTYAFVRLEY